VSRVQKLLQRAAQQRRSAAQGPTQGPKVLGVSDLLALVGYPTAVLNDSVSEVDVAAAVARVTPPPMASAALRACVVVGAMERWRDEGSDPAFGGRFAALASEGSGEDNEASEELDCSSFGAERGATAGAVTSQCSKRSRSRSSSQERSGDDKSWYLGRAVAWCPALVALASGKNWPTGRQTTNVPTKVVAADGAMATFSSLIDSGSDLSLITVDLLRRGPLADLPIQPLKQGEFTTVGGVEQQGVVKLLGRVDVLLCISDASLITRLYVAETLPVPVILGGDFQVAHSASLVWRRGKAFYKPCPKATAIVTTATGEATEATFLCTAATLVQEGFKDLGASSSSEGHSAELDPSEEVSSARPSSAAEEDLQDKIQ
jgi:hypothetical protein